MVYELVLEANGLLFTSLIVRRSRIGIVLTASWRIYRRISRGMRAMLTGLSS